MCPVCVNLKVEFTFKMHFKEYLGQKYPNFFLTGQVLVCLVLEAFIEVHLFQETSPEQKFPGCAPELEA